jgi:hypothetical protein
MQLDVLNFYSETILQHLVYQSQMSHDNIVSIVTHYGLDSPGIEYQWRPDFPHLSRPALGPPSLLYYGYRVSLPGVKRPGRSANYPPPSSAKINVRVLLYLHSPSAPSWPLLGQTSPLPKAE